MKFRLSTLLIVVTAIAVLSAQFGSPDRLAIVAGVELLFLVAWIGAKGDSFPWKTIVAVAVGVDVVGASTAFAQESHASWESAFGAATFVAFIGGLLLAMVIGMFHALYNLVEALFRTNRPKFGPRHDLHTGEPIE
jgi:hypothetical protein